MKMKVEIRNYKSKDKSQLLDLIDLNTPKYFDPEEKEGLIHYLENELEDYFVVEQGGVVLGCGGINYDDNFKVGIIS